MAIAFIIWFAVGAALFGLGIYAFVSKRTAAFGFWANAEMFPVKDVRGYNRAVGKLWCAFGAGFALLGVPLLSGQNSAYVLLSILGAMAEAIAAMVIYVTVIEKKYRSDR